MAPRKKDVENSTPEALALRHLRIGWTGLLLFMGGGLLLEALHGLKQGFYLDADQTTRRLMWTLAHAHGTLFSLIHIAFALTLRSVPGADLKRLRIVSAGLTGGLIALPAGFSLGGVWVYGGDPGPGVLLVPVGAIMMLVAVAVFLRVVFQPPQPAAEPPREKPPAKRRRK